MTPPDTPDTSRSRAKGTAGAGMTPAGDPTTREPVIPPVDPNRRETREDATAVRNPVEARQGEETGRVRWVLTIGVVVTALVFLIAYLVVFPG